MWRFGFFDAVETAPGVYDRVYNAEEFSVPFSALIDTGVLEGAGDSLEVTTDGSSMQTTIGTGVAFIRGRYAENTSPRAHTHDTETVGVDRIDRIVIRLDLRPEARHVESFVKKGVASSNPVPPALQRDDNVYEISLAQVRIRGGQTFISSSDIIDERGDEDICPWARSKVLPHIDAGDVAQLRDEFDAFKEEVGPIVQIENETVTVGTSGDFSTINEALEYLSKRHARFWPNGYTAEIRLLSGFVMQEQVFVEGVDLGWITITSEDSEVTIERTFLTRVTPIELVDYTRRPAFFAYNNATLPTIGALFVMDTSGGAETRDGIVVSHNSRAIIKPGCGVKGVGSDYFDISQRPFGILVSHTSTVEMAGAIFSESASCLRAELGSVVHAQEADLSGARLIGVEGDRSVIYAPNVNASGANNHSVYAFNHSVIDVSYADLSGSDVGGIRAEHGCLINATESDISGGGPGGNAVNAVHGSIVNVAFANCRRELGIDNPSDISITGGAIVVMRDTLGGTDVTPNTLLPQGIIFDE